MPASRSGSSSWPTGRCRSPSTSATSVLTPAQLRKRLRAQGAEVFDGFPDYGKAFRRRLGIDTEQAMELFGQTVSMKAVDNLNGFVRQHMLEPFDVRARLDALVGHFEDLVRAHEAVLRARAQLDMLQPLIGDLDEHAALSRQLSDLTAQRDALPFFLADRRRGLLEVELVAIDEQVRGLEADRQRAEAECDRLREAEMDLGRQISGHGGDRIEALARRNRTARAAARRPAAALRPPQRAVGGRPPRPDR